MKLVHVDIQRYRSIDEPTQFDVEPDVTALVGKNESGKTAVLQSLYKSDPVDNTTEFVSDFDFPSHKSRELAKGEPIRVTELTYELDEDDIDAVEQKLCLGALKSKRIVIITGFLYDEPEWLVEIDEMELLNTLRDTLDLPSVDKRKVDDASNISELAAALRNLESSIPSADAALKIIDGWPDCDPVLAAIDVLAERRPKFVYFGDYDVMPGKISIPQLIQRRRDNNLTRGQEALLSLLSIAGVDPEDFSSPESHEQLIRQLENASNTISDEVFEYWSQNTELQVQLHILSRPEPAAEPPLDKGPLLQIRVENKRHRVTVPFDERSRGFVWFFSFLAYFSKLEEEATQPLILLLDEPGLSLHATAQHDLLRFVDERLASRHQVIFTTHSPFMIDPHSFQRVRTVVDEVARGTVVSADVLRADSESAFPLHAALGIQLTQTLFVGPNVLLVEGPSDVVFLQYLSDQLTKAGKPGLSEKWVLVPGGGIAKLPAFLALFGANSMKVAVLTDSSAENDKLVNAMRNNGKLYSVGIVEVGNATGAIEADIEDILPSGLYLKLINDAYAGLLADKPLTVDQLPKGDRIVKRVEEAFASRGINNGHINHYSPAGALLRQKSMPKLKNDELAQAERLVSSINSLLDN
ncbi:ATP-dependent nuclease [Actinomyces qiguomingii]|uniref:ATP-dependent nuclease n=1 Tax=Actinomyces qiguomingii TaxID=2057800 RepID=UPI000CA02F9E|nr:AAA family ATPase [Actinomyces qiguomingii]